jgi:hypothetical protein
VRRREHPDGAAERSVAQRDSLLDVVLVVEHPLQADARVDDDGAVNVAGPR